MLMGLLPRGSTCFRQLWTVIHGSPAIPLHSLQSRVPLGKLPGSSHSELSW